MILFDLFKILADARVQLSVENGALKVSAPKGAVTPAILAELKNNKDELLKYLQKPEKKDHRIMPVSRDLDLRLSYAQQRLWLLDRIDGGSAHYNMPAALKLAGALNQDAVSRAFTTIIARHESLRTCFTDGGDGQPLQVIQAAAPFAMDLTDLSAFASGERQLKLTELLTEEAGSVFDLSRDLMLRARLLRMATDEHILLVTMHHIASDGWSMTILINEFSRLYQAYTLGQPDPLPPLTIQYADYAHWQRNWLQGEVLAQQLDYWTGQLANLPVVHSLPLDHARPNMQSFVGETYTSQIDVATSGVLNTLCQASGATLFMGLHAAFSVLLARYSNETDIVLGSPIANREQAEVADLIGFFINTLILRCDLSGNPSFAELLARSKAMLLDAYAHQQVPFEQIVERLQPARSLSHSPLFQVMLVLQNNEVGRLELPGLTLSPVEPTASVAKYDLTLSISESAQGLTLAWEYNTDLFEAATIARMAQHFGILLKALTSTPQASVFSIDMLSDAERRQLLMEWNNTATDYPRDQCIHELFEAQALQNPDAVAVVFEDKQLSYSELDAKANQLAHYLVMERQVKPDTLVGICIERSLEMVIAILGILKAGGAYVPLDPDYPPARLEYMLADANLTTVLTQCHLLERTPIKAEQALRLDDVGIRQLLATLPAHSVSDQVRGLHARHLAYVIYTSGSTGNPKGVMVEHRALLNRIDWMDRHYGSSPSDRILQKTPFSFDVSVWEFVWPLSVGARIVLAKPEGHKDPLYLTELIRAQQITKLHFVPSMLGSMLALGDLSQCVSLRQVFCSGEALALHHVEQFHACCPFAELHNLYGPTEAAIDVSYWDCSQLSAGQGSVPIGRPIHNIQLHVMNPQLVPQGVAGELHIGGVGLARGYLNRPDLTAEKFIANPFHDASDPVLSLCSERLYKTGDLVRWLPDGNLEYLGRIDHQVKIRGFRIELGEIENALTSHPQVSDAVVLAKDGAAGDKRLVAYVVMEVTNDASLVTQGESEAAIAARHALIDSLRQHLSSSLPDYMVPAAYVLLTSLPVTPNGKVDRKALPEPDASQQQASYVAPTTATGKLLCMVWAQVLGVERVGMSDNFFRLGGHSLLVIHVIARLQQSGVSIAARQMFTTSTVAELAALIDSEVGSSAVFRAPPNLIPDDCTQIAPEMLPLLSLTADEVAVIVAQVPGGAANVKDIYPLASLQEGILFHHRMSTQSDPYVMPMLFSARTQAHLQAFLNALELMIERHDALRTAVLWNDLPAPVQVVYRKATLPVSWLEFAPEQDVQAEMQALCEPGLQWMDLGSAPLLRVRLAADPHSDRYFILLQLHHLIDDATSLNILSAEIFACLTGRTHTLATPIPYREFVAHAIDVDARSHAEAFFRKQLGDIDEPTAPFNLLDVQGDGSRNTQTYETVPADVANALRGVAKRMMISPAALFHAAWAMVIAACSGRDDVVFGTVLSGRLQGTVGAENTVGMFINTMPLRVRLGNTTAAELVLNVHTALMDLLPYEQASLTLVQRCSGLPGGSPLFSAMLNYRHTAGAADGQDDVHAADVGIEVLAFQERANYPFDLSVDDRESGFSLDMQVDASVGSARVVAYMQAALSALVEALQVTPDRAVQHLSVLPETERRQLLVAWNDTATDYPRDQCIHELFEQRAAQQPDAVAVVYEGEQLSYGELNAKANQLAHYLVEHRQVRPDSLVGICVERSLDMVIGILAILKAGGAYVPLDPDYPAARLSYMLGDAKLTTVLTQRHLLACTPIKVAQAVCLDDISVQQLLAMLPVANIVPQSLALHAQHLAYVIYTSGSTGNPKGVMICHQGVVNLACWLGKRYRLGVDDKVLQFAPISFDVSAEEIFGALSSGSTLVVRASDWIESVAHFWQRCMAAGVTVLNLPTAFWHELAYDKAALPAACVRHISLGGEKVSEAAIRAWYAKPGPLPTLLNSYGPTECTVDTSTAELLPDARNTIGKGLDNTSLFVLSTQGLLLPIGVAGELHIGGVGLARGYLNRPELTAEKFIANPFHDASDPSSSERLYKTGDLVRWLADGSLEFLGRIDHQVKIRGFRIELGEIENALSSHAQVSDAVVLAWDSAVGDKRLVAYVVTNDAGFNAQDESEMALTARNGLIEGLRQHLGSHLPDYMVPAAYVLLDSLPLTPNGKIDRKALPEPDASQLQGSYAAPATETEKLLCTVWEQVLGVEHVGTSDNFFQLGGHSLLVMQVIARLQQYGISVGARQLFTTSTLAELAALIDSTVELTSEFQTPPNRIPRDCTHITPDMLPLITLSAIEIEHIAALVPGGVANIQDIYPLAPLQEGILFHHVMSGQNDPYVMDIVFAISGQAAVEQFIEALQFVIDRHDVLRSVILWNDLSAPLQVVCRQAKLEATWLELDPCVDVQAHMLALSETGTQWIDLGNAPLIRLKIAADSASGLHVVLLQSHHIIADHVTMDLIQQELALYMTGHASTLPESSPYRDFIAYEQHLALRNDPKVFFRALLGDFEEASVPFNLHDVQGDGRGMAEFRQAVPAEVANDLRVIAKAMMISPAALFHAAWAMVVSASSGRDDVVFGTIMSGRLQGMARAEHMLGMFINTLPLRVKLGGISAIELVQQVHGALRDLLPYEQTSLALAQHCSGLPGGIPLFTGLLNYRHSAPFEDVLTDGASAQHSTVNALKAQERTNYPISLSVDDMGEGFALELQIDATVDPQRVIAYMQEALAALSKALVVRPDISIHKLSVLPQAERHQLLLEWNNTTTDYPRDQCIHQLFEAQAAQNPDAVAVVFDGQQLSYAELNAKANQLAHYLMAEKQVKPDTLVGICVERSLDMVIGILGILKAGGAYVPLDPDYPPARLEYMLGDANLSTVLTQSHLLARTPISAMQAVCLDDVNLQARLADQSGANTDGTGIGAAQLAYVIYTSGSTGNPKGVMVEHGSVVSLVINNNYVSLSCDTVMLQNAPVAFDAATFEIWGALLNGGKLVVQGESLLDMDGIGRFIEAHSINTAWMTSGLFDQFAAIYDAPLPELTNLLVGGDVVNRRSVELMQGRNPGITLINGYGPTENTTFSCCYQIPFDNTALKPIPIGRPLANRSAYVLDAGGALVPKGVVGELHVGGVGLARGYLNRPELTEEKFIANPFRDASDPVLSLCSERLYKTGDLVRWLPDGNLEYLGRIDHQVKIRGFRIEPGEIENALASHAQVSDAVVLARDSAVGDKRLVAYVVTNDTGFDAQDQSETALATRHALIEGLRQHLGRTLPDYMVPAAWVLLASLPLNPNGKVDRKALPEPDASQQQAAYVAARSETEQLLCGLWQEVLGLERVGITDNFFQLGGHSLLAIRFLSKVRALLKVEVPVHAVFSNPTIEHIAGYIDALHMNDINSNSVSEEFFEEGTF